MERILFGLAALGGGLAVILGAWGAHAGAALFSEQQSLWFEKAVRYQMHHSLALFAVAWALVQWPARAPWTASAGWAMLLGMLLFCGCLYLLAFDIADPGYLTPVGGSLMILGWLLLALSVWSA